MPFEEEPLPHSAQRRRVRWGGDLEACADSDWVAVEEPLALSVAGIRLGVLMRTPGDDLDLALGFALTEGIFERAEEVARIHHTDAEENDLVLVPQRDSMPRLDLARRGLLVSSSCGVCGRLTIDQVRAQCRGRPRRGRLSAPMIRRLPSALSEFQSAFRLSGGHHAAALARFSGEILLVREDIGRHNAVDKVIGAAFSEGLDVGELLLFVSGRCSFEIVQKAAMVGIGAAASVGAVSSLAIDLAREVGVSLFGFVSADRLCCYFGEEFIDGRATIA